MRKKTNSKLRQLLDKQAKLERELQKLKEAKSKVSKGAKS